MTDIIPAPAQLTKPTVRREADGTISAVVTITMKPEQWSKFERHFGARAMSCQIGLDSPQAEDFAMFQIFMQMKEALR